MKKLLYLLLFVPLSLFGQSDNFYGLNCGESISIQDQISGGHSESEFSNLSSYNRFSFYIDSYNTSVELELSSFSLEELVGWIDGYLIVFKDGNWNNSYYFSDGYSDAPHHMLLSQGEYTFICAPYSGSVWGGNLEYFSQNYSPNNSDSFQIDLTMTMYDGSCYKEGCTDLDAFNFNASATSDDGSCNYISQLGALNCGQQSLIQDEIIGGDFNSDNPNFGVFSFNIYSENAILETQCDIESMGWLNGNIVIFKNGYWYGSYWFDPGYVELPQQMSLSQGEYTFFYGYHSPGGWGENLENFSQNYSPSNNSDSFQIDLTMTMYDGSCYKEGCTDPNALNFNASATSDDGSCNYISQLGSLNCGESVLVQEQLYINAHSGINFIIPSTSDSIYISFDFAEIDSESDGLPESLYIFKDGELMEFNNWYEFPPPDNYLILSPGDYTFIYGPSLCSYSHGLNSFLDYLSSTANFCWYESMIYQSVFNLNITMYDGQCSLEGCTDSTALNYNYYANLDDLSCVYPIDISVLECGVNNIFTGNSDRPDYFIFELIEPLEIEFNYNSSSVSSPNLYLYDSSGFLLHNTSIQSSYVTSLNTGIYYFILDNNFYTQYIQYNSLGSFYSAENNYYDNQNNSDGYANGYYTLDIFTQNGLCEIYGCTDSMALNFESNADLNDNSCIYPNLMDSIICGENYSFSDTLNQSNSFQSMSFIIPDSTNFRMECYIDNDFTLNAYSTNPYGSKTASIFLFRNDTLYMDWHVSEDIYSSNMLLDIDDEINLVSGQYTLIYLDRINHDLLLLSDLFNLIPIYEGEAIFNFDIISFDGSCEYSGCTDSLALNYNSTATLDDMECIHPVDLGILNCGHTIERALSSSSFYDYSYSFELENNLNVSFSCKSTYPPSITIFNEFLEIVDVLYPESFASGTVLNQSIDLNPGKYYIYINKSWDYEGIQYHEIDDQTEFLLDNHNISILAYDGECDLFGCTDQNAINYNKYVSYDDGSCVSYFNIGTLDCGVNYQFNSDTVQHNSYSLLNSNCQGQFSDIQQYSSANFTLNYSSIIDINSFAVAFDCDGVNTDGLQTMGACILLNDTIIQMYHWQNDSTEITMIKDIFPLELAAGQYKYITFPIPFQFNTDIVGLTNLELINRIGAGHHYNDNFFTRSNISVFDGNCDFEGCMNSQAYNFNEFYTINNESFCLFSENISCGETKTIELQLNDEFGYSGSSVYLDHEALISFQLENQTTISVSGHSRIALFNDNVFNVISNEYSYTGHHEFILSPGNYLFGIESNESNTLEFELNCLGCMNSNACNYNDDANINNNMCNYAENDCDFCSDGIIFNSDVNNNNICDGEEIYGCTDSIAINFNISANVNDLSCEYYPTSQTILLPSGWSMFSTYLEPSNYDLVIILDSIQEEILLVKDNYGQPYWPEFSFNGIGDIVNGNGYQIKINSNNQVTILNIDGEFLNPEINPIILDAGWNIIGYLRTDYVSAEDLLSELNEEGNLIIAKNYLGAAYLPEFGFNGIGYFFPGQGYQLKTNYAGFLWVLPMNQNY